MIVSELKSRKETRTDRPEVVALALLTTLHLPWIAKPRPLFILYTWFRGHVMHASLGLDTASPLLSPRGFQKRTGEERGGAAGLATRRLPQ
jgi:hypothetical protein